MVLYVEQRYTSDDGEPANWNIDDPTILALLTSHSNEFSSASSERLDVLAEQKLAGQRQQQPPPPASRTREKGT